jgi:hypothetical protein
MEAQHVEHGARHFLIHRVVFHHEVRVRANHFAAGARRAWLSAVSQGFDAAMRSEMHSGFTRLRFTPAGGVASASGGMSAMTSTQAWAAAARQALTACFIFAAAFESMDDADARVARTKIPAVPRWRWSRNPR